MRSKTAAALTFAIALSAFILQGCGNHEKQTSAETSSPAAASADGASPEDLGRIGAEIRKQPQDAAKILTSHGMTEQAFEAAVRKVGESPEASKRYAAAFKQAGG